MIIGQGQIAMDPIKLTTICDWKPPTSIKGIHSFLGFANFYCKFIPNFSHVVTPLNLLTRQDQPWNWTPLQQKAFNTLHTAFSSRPVLGIPDVTRPFSIMTDASLFTPELSSFKMISMVTCILVLTSPKCLSLQSEITISMIGNSLLSSSHSRNGNNTSKEPHTLLPLSPTTKTSPISKTPTNCLNPRLAGPSSSRTLI